MKCDSTRWFSEIAVFNRKINKPAASWWRIAKDMYLVASGTLHQTNVLFVHTAQNWVKITVSIVIHIPIYLYMCSPPRVYTRNIVLCILMSGRFLHSPTNETHTLNTYIERMTFSRFHLLSFSIFLSVCSLQCIHVNIFSVCFNFVNWQSTYQGAH